MMRSRRIENIVKYTAIGAGILAFIASFAISRWTRPAGGLETVLSREVLIDGKPRQTVSKYEKKAVNYTQGMFYPADTDDFSEANRPERFGPTKRYQFEFDPAQNRSMFVARDGQKQENPIMKAGGKYTVQFVCPPNMESIRMTYNGIEIDSRLFKPKDENHFVAKADFEPIAGTAKLKAHVKYANGERDEFDIPVRGQ